MLSKCHGAFPLLLGDIIMVFHAMGTRSSQRGTRRCVGRVHVTWQRGKEATNCPRISNTQMAGSWLLRLGLTCSPNCRMVREVEGSGVTFHDIPKKVATFGPSGFVVDQG